MGKLIKIGAGLAVGFVLFVGLALFFGGGELVRSQLETAITNALGTPSQVATVRLNPVVGRITIGEITVSNPSGLTTPYFMDVRELAIKVRPLTLLQNVIQIENFTIGNWNINIEQNLNRGNLSEVAAHMGNRQPQAQQEGAPANARKVTSDVVTIGRVNTQFKLAFLNLQREFTFSDISLTNVSPENAAAVFLDQYIVSLVSRTLEAVLEESKQNVPGISLLQGLIDRLP